MEVLVDTSIWSLALRRNRRKAGDESLVNRFAELISETRVRIIGPDLPISKNYERAAEMHNQYRRNGINGGHIDFLICSVAEYYYLAIFTNDKEFVYYAKHLTITLY